MSTTAPTEMTNSKRTGKAERAQRALSELLSEVTSGGFFGAATLSLSVQDGHIQHIKAATERIVK